MKNVADLGKTRIDKIAHSLINNAISIQKLITNKFHSNNKKSETCIQERSISKTTHKLEELFKQNEIIIFGDNHGSRKQHEGFADIVKHLNDIGEKFDVYLEFYHTDQSKMNTFLDGQLQIKDILGDSFWLGYENILNTCKKNDIHIVCFDKKVKDFTERDEFMANKLLDSPNKKLIMVGANHLIKSNNPEIYSKKDVVHIEMQDAINANENSKEKDNAQINFNEETLIEDNKIYDYKLNL